MVAAHRSARSGVDPRARCDAVAGAHGLAASRAVRHRSTTVPHDGGATGSPAGGGRGTTGSPPVAWSGSMTGFVDESQLNVRGGDGGAGCVSFRREGPEVMGGPNGGDGGKGGDVWLVADRNVASLLAFRDHPHRRAGNGVHGKGKDLHGASRRGPAASTCPRAPSSATSTPARSWPTSSTTATAGWPPPAAGAGGATPSSCPTAAGRPSFAEQGEHGEERWLQARAEADGRRRPRRLPQRRQEHVHQPHLGGQAQDRRLPVHHPRAAPRRRAPRRRLRDDRRRHPRPHRGRQRGPGPRPPVPAPHRAGPGAVRAGRPGRRRRHAARPSRRPSCCASWAPTGPSCSSGPASSSGTKADVAVDAVGRAAHLGGHRRGRAASADGRCAVLVERGPRRGARGRRAS